MKLAITKIFVLVLVFIMLTLVACSQSDIVIAVVLSASAGTDGSYTLFLYNDLDNGQGTGLFYADVPSDIVDKDGNAIAVTDIQPGQLVEVTYSGYVQETYPAGYTGVSKVKVLGQAADDLYAIASEQAAEWEKEIAEAEKQAGL